MKLNEIKIDKEVKIKNLKLEGAMKTRMLDLGMIEGTKIKPVFRSPLGDPTAYEVRRKSYFYKRRRCKKNRSIYLIGK